MVDKTAITLRPARCSKDDGLHFARYLNQAADGFFNVMLGREAEGMIAAAFMEAGHSMSHEHVCFAQLDGRVVGMSSAYSGEQQRHFSEPSLRPAGLAGVVRRLCLWPLLAPMLRRLETIAIDDFYLQGIAVEPGFRGAGVGTLLLDDVERRSRHRGLARLSLDVAANNAGGRRLYARRGMVESMPWPDSSLLPTMLIRMSKPL